MQSPCAGTDGHSSARAVMYGGGVGEGGGRGGGAGGVGGCKLCLKSVSLTNFFLVLGVSLTSTCCSFGLV